MKSNVISLLLVALLVVAVADRATAAGALTNHLGQARTNADVALHEVDVEDYLSVYRFDMGGYGAFDVVMYDGRTPLTAANFRNYADRGDYDGTFLHRSVPGFILQGGGFTCTDIDVDPVAVASDPPVLNEPFIANSQGTIALAKTGAGPNTGTNQWYFNTTDNPGLDDPANNGGYTTFGEVLYNGMDVVDTIAGLTSWDASGLWPILYEGQYYRNDLYKNLPLSDAFDGTRPVEVTDLVTVDSISQVTGLTYEVVSSSNTALVALGALTGSALDVIEGVVGRADLTIRVTDGSQWFDADLQVQAALDLDSFRTNWGMSSPTWADGDLNEDGTIDTTDLVIWATYHNTGYVPTTPEPATCMILGIGGLVSLARRRR